MSKYLELFAGSFDESIVEKTKLENRPYVAYSIKDKGVIYTIVPKKDEEGMYTVRCVKRKDISGLEYNAVDLGLPSGCLWADRNVGASSVEDFGSYFQWGSIDSYNYGDGEITAAQLAKLLTSLLGPELTMEITADNVHEVLTMLLEEDPGYDIRFLTDGLAIKFLINDNDDKFMFDWYNYFDTNDNGSTFNKYSNEEGKLKVLESVDDAATVHMGFEWRMPTTDEFHELLINTTPTWIDINDKEYSIHVDIDFDVKGLKLTSDINNNSIFIPVAGYCSSDILNNMYNKSHLWCNSLYNTSDLYNTSESKSAYFLYISNGVRGGTMYVNDGLRYYGLSVRGVKKPQVV